MHIRSVPLFVLIALLTAPAGLLGNPPYSPVAIYRYQASALVYQTVSSALLKDPHPSEASVTVTLQLDVQGHVSNLAIVANKGGQWAKDRAREAMTKVKFQPAAKVVRDDFERHGIRVIDVTTNVGFG